MRNTYHIQSKAKILVQTIKLSKIVKKFTLIGRRKITVTDKTQSLLSYNHGLFNDCYVGKVLDESQIEFFDVPKKYVEIEKR